MHNKKDLEQSNIKISVITPSIRLDSLEVVKRSLDKQNFSSESFEWLIDTEATKNKDDFYGLNKAWNRLIQKSKGELLVSICDRTEFPEYTLKRLWQHYQRDKKSCVNGVGYQYKNKEKVWSDPRLELVTGNGLCWMVPQYNEFRLTSFPRVAAFDVGGLDELYDRVAANSEKEFALRMFKKGYEFYLDKRLKFKFYQHEEHGKEWDEKYLIGAQLLKKHFDEILDDKREEVHYL